jgi:hypothetical protein
MSLRINHKTVTRIIIDLRTTKDQFNEELKGQPCQKPENNTNEIAILFNRNPGGFAHCKQLKKR